MGDAPDEVSRCQPARRGVAVPSKRVRVIRIREKFFVDKPPHFDHIYTTSRIIYDDYSSQIIHYLDDCCFAHNDSSTNNRNWVRTILSFRNSSHKRAHDGNNHGVAIESLFVLVSQNDQQRSVRLV
jgi:hypothetical protein